MSMALHCRKAHQADCLDSEVWNLKFEPRVKVHNIIAQNLSVSLAVVVGSEPSIQHSYRYPHPTTVLAQGLDLRQASHLADAFGPGLHIASAESRHRQGPISRRLAATTYSATASPKLMFRWRRPSPTLFSRDVSPQWRQKTRTGGDYLPHPPVPHWAAAREGGRAGGHWFRTQIWCWGNRINATIVETRGPVLNWPLLPGHAWRIVHAVYAHPPWLPPVIRSIPVMRGPPPPPPRPPAGPPPLPPPGGRRFSAFCLSAASGLMIDCRLWAQKG